MGQSLPFYEIATWLEKKTSTIFGRIPLVFQDTISFEKKKGAKPEGIYEGVLSISL